MVGVPIVKNGSLHILVILLAITEKKVGPLDRKHLQPIRTEIARPTQARSHAFDHEVWRKTTKITKWKILNRKNENNQRFSRPNWISEKMTESETSRLNNYLEITLSKYDRMRENSKSVRIISIFSDLVPISKRCYHLDVKF